MTSETSWNMSKLETIPEMWKPMGNNKCVLNGKTWQFNMVMCHRRLQFAPFGPSWTSFWLIGTFFVPLHNFVRFGKFFAHVSTTPTRTTRTRTTKLLLGLLSVDRSQKTRQIFECTPRLQAIPRLKRLIWLTRQTQLSQLTNLTSKISITRLAMLANNSKFPLFSP